MPNVNPEILIWARETAGLTLEEASRKLGINKARGKKPVERLQALENGDVTPSRTLLLKMTKQYRRPLIVFYMDNPPRKANRGQDFRTLPDRYPDITKGLVDALIRDVQARQNILRAALEEDDDMALLPVVGSMKLEDGVAAVNRSIKEFIGFNLGVFRAQSSHDDAFKYLRTQVEKSGIYVILIGNLGSHHTALDVNVFRGFALSDKLAPIVAINDKDARAAWSFTLLHELAHIWLGQTGISSGTRSDLKVEKFCNQVAGEILLPDIFEIELPKSQDFDAVKDAISDFAYTHNVSNSMIAYRLFTVDVINQDTWYRLHKTYKKSWQDARDNKKALRRGKGGGPSYYVVRRHRLGDHLISQVNRMMQGGALTTVKAGKVLGVSPKNIQALLEPKFKLSTK
jgi:Zn-dependent peptidase ImmA (M78 family)/transcriptional regulator with XRE-family HTH domain